MSLHDKVVKELGYGMNTPNETDIAFMALWVSRRADGSLNSTACNIEEEPLTEELKERIATVLRNLAESICPTKRAADLAICTDANHVGPFLRTPEGNTKCDACGEEW